MKEISRITQKACFQIRIFDEKYVQQVHQSEASKYSVYY